MLAQERQGIILNLLHEQEVVKVSELCDRFNVSVETIRRDLDYLSKQGKLKRVYGGAVMVEKAATEPAYNYRFIKNESKKRKIGKETSKLIANGDTLIIDLGTTTLEVAKHLKHKKNLTVITNSLYIARELVDIPENRVIVIGGNLRAGELTTSGIFVEEILKSFNVDKVIIGVGGITIENGISDYHLDEARARKIMTTRGKHVIAVADHSKFDVEALVNICPIEEIDTLVTDDKVPSHIINQYKNRNLNVIIAD